jgi:hypothetical protein
VREANLKIKEEQDLKKLQHQLSQNKMSPRTFNQRKREIEVWVTKEKDDIRRCRDQYAKDRINNRN